MYNPCTEEIQKVWGQLVIKGLAYCIRAKLSDAFSTILVSL